MFAISAQFAGAVATVEFLTYFDYFARKDYGDDYLETHGKEIANHMQQVVYSINQPAAAGLSERVLEYFRLRSILFRRDVRRFRLPDFTKPVWTSVAKLQNFFLKWFNQERTKAVLTFPSLPLRC